jgi:hypothetical protein
MESEFRECPACGVKICGNKAHFSVGKPQNLDVLSTRVCQYKKVDQPCINPQYDRDKTYPSAFDDIL